MVSNSDHAPLREDVRIREDENPVQVEETGEELVHLTKVIKKSGPLSSKGKAPPKTAIRTLLHAKHGLRTSVNTKGHAKGTTHQIAENSKKDIATEDSIVNGDTTTNAMNPKHTHSPKLRKMLKPKRMKEPKKRSKQG